MRPVWSLIAILCGLPQAAAIAEESIDCDNDLLERACSRVPGAGPPSSPPGLPGLPPFVPDELPAVPNTPDVPDELGTNELICRRLPTDLQVGPGPDGPLPDATDETVKDARHPRQTCHKRLG